MSIGEQSGLSRGARVAKSLRALLSPQIVARRVIRSLALGSLEFRLAMQALEKAQYAFGIKQAIYLASRLNHRRVAVIEFGVGTGRGLRLMEAYAEELGRAHGIEVDVYGFDLGSGLPAPRDFRDMPYAWQAGDYAMQAQQLQRELKSAKLLLGDVQETIPEFTRSGTAPVGFISFDLDFYSSTIAAFQILEAADELLLPRIVCYFDDVASDERQLHCDQTGELLAISEFNCRAGNHQKLSKTFVSSYGLAFPAPWLDQIWIYHRFSHRDYNTYIKS
jgi:hypothetical protein